MILCSVGFTYLYFRTQTPSDSQVKTTLARQVQYKIFSVIPDIKGGVTALAFAQSGRTLVIGTGDGRIVIWDASQKAITSTIPAHEKDVAAVAQNSDGSLLASGSSDGTVKVWHVSRKEKEWPFEGGSNPLSFSPSAPILAIGINNNVRLYNMDSTDMAEPDRWRVLANSNTGWPAKVTFSPDGTILAVAGQSPDSPISIWRADDDWSVLRKLVVRSGVNDISLGPNASLAAAGSDGAITLWELNSNQLRRTLSGQNGTISSVAFSEDGQLLAAGSESQTVDLWDPQTGTLLESLGTQNNIIHPLVFSPGSGRLLAAGVSTELVIWIRADQEPD